MGNAAEVRSMNRIIDGMKDNSSFQERFGSDSRNINSSGFDFLNRNTLTNNISLLTKKHLDSRSYSPYSLHNHNNARKRSRSDFVFIS